MMTRYRVVIVDDEALARLTIWRLVARTGDFEVVGEATDGQSALTVIRDKDPDLVFLDVRMPGMDGIAVARLVSGDRAPLVVICTAHEDHAVDAFTVHAVDYLLKPFDDARFADCLEGVRRRLGTEAMADLHRRNAAASWSGSGGVAPAGVPADRLAVRVGSGIRLVDPARIDWIAARGYHAELRMADGTQLVRESLTRLESRLDPRHFVRIQRSAIVRIDRVREILSDGHGDGAVILEDGTRLRLSRTRRAEVLGRLGLAGAG